MFLVAIVQNNSVGLFGLIFVMLLVFCISLFERDGLKLFVLLVGLSLIEVKVCVVIIFELLV